MTVDDRLAWRVEQLERNEERHERDRQELKGEMGRAKTASYQAKDACEAVAADQRVLVERMGNMISAYKAQRTALYTAAGALVVVAAGLILRALGLAA